MGKIYIWLFKNLTFGEKDLYMIVQNFNIEWERFTYDCVQKFNVWWERFIYDC